MSSKPFYLAFTCLLVSACGDTKKASDAATDSCEAPPAAPAAGTMPACQATMFNKYGDAGFTAVNQKVIELATTQAIVASIGDSFQTRIVSASDARKAEFTANLKAFLVQAYGGPEAYAGPTMASSHADLKITTAQYNNFIGMVVVPALEAVGVTADDVTNCFAPQVTDAHFVSQFVTCK